MLPLTQSHLTLFETCPRKYQLVCFDALSGPSSHEQHDKTQWGSQFHLLMQQQALNLPVSTVAAADSEMSASLQALEQAAPDVFAHLPVSQAIDSSRSDASSQPDTFSQSEHRRKFAFNGYLLTVIYDLLVISDEERPSGQIYDWKTHQKPPPKAKLENDWQTRLYLFVLCETTKVKAQDASMTYWFVRPSRNTRNAQSTSGSKEQTKPSAYTFQYSAAKHEQTRRELSMLTNQLNDMRAGEYFPKVPVGSDKCDRCVFNVRCDRALPNSPLQQDPNRLLKAASQITADIVEEVSL